MTCPPEPDARSAWRRAIVSGGVACCGLVSGSWAVNDAAHAASAALPSPAPSSAADATSGAAWLVMAALLLLAMAVVGVWAGALQARVRRQAAALNTAAGLGELLDVWVWRTDTRLQVVDLRPPAQAASGSAADAAPQALRQHADGPPLPLWELFSADGTSFPAWRAALESHAAFTDVPARWCDHVVLLRGRPQRDADGLFSHYLGTLRVLPSPLQPPEVAPAETAPLLQALDSPALEVRAAPDGWQVQAGNAAAAHWLGLTEAQLVDAAWPVVAARLPAAARSLVQPTLGLQTPALVTLADGWSMRLLPLPARADAAPPAAWLVFQNQAAPDAPGASEQETFSYTVSHDLRAPIRVVEGFTKILKEDYGKQLDRVGNDHLDRVLGASARMNSMIDSLLALSQLSTQPLARQPIHLSQLVGYVIDDLRRQSPERQVRVEIEPGLHVHGDATLLRVALENLLGNAWKYTAKRPDACIFFESSEHEGRPAFTVRDNGAGFDMRFADRLFGVFQRLHSATEFQGTGIGLASVRRIIRRHGGDIWAEGEVNRGARFQFWLRH